jgi:hypothetical protein
MVRRGRTIMGAVLLPLLFVSPALGQPPSTESVTVTGTKSREVLQGFVKSLAAPTRFTGKIARWNDGICPIVAGLPSGFSKFVLQRVREVAAQAGAPVNNKAACKPNIEIAFTTKPQALIDSIRRTNIGYLGYHDNKAQLDGLAAVTRPIQAWYATATRDVNGQTDIDSAKVAGIGLRVPCTPCPGGYTYLPNARAVAVTGTRLGDGLRSLLYHVTIVADPSQLKEYEMGSLADYIAMLALTQLDSLDTCQQLPSIVNMLAKHCDSKSDTLTENDSAYLRGLYKMASDGTLQTQRDAIAFQMEQGLTKH